MTLRQTSRFAAAPATYAAASSAYLSRALKRRHRRQTRLSLASRPASSKRQRYTPATRSMPFILFRDAVQLTLTQATAVCRRLIRHRLFFVFHTPPPRLKMARAVFFIRPAMMPPFLRARSRQRHDARQCRAAAILAIRYRIRAAKSQQNASAMSANRQPGFAAPRDTSAGAARPSLRRRAFASNSRVNTRLPP